MTVSAWIALGSNVGDRPANLDRALEALRALPGLEVVRVSSYWQTTPVGGPPGQGDFLNGAAELRTTLEPRDLLRVLLEVEQSLGRVRAERNGPRTIDLDVLLYGDLVSTEPELTLPHPRMHERRFVLEPLAQIAPFAVHPGQRTTIRELLARLPMNQDRPCRDLAGMRAVVTGATSGIGRAIALELAALGADVIVHGRNAVTADAVVQRIQQSNVRARSLLADLRSPEECQRLVDAAWREWHGLDIWINNAGADTLTGEAARWPFERKLQELWAVDVQATMLLSRAVGARMKARGNGVVLNMGWDQAETGMEGDSGQLFGATKAAVIAFSKSLALSLAPQVRVNCLAPGWIRTAWGEHASGTWQARVRHETPLDRWGTPEDVAAAAHWLVSPAAAFITGQTVRVNGGAVR